MFLKFTHAVCVSEVHSFLCCIIFKMNIPKFTCLSYFHGYLGSFSVQFNHVWLFAIPWTAAHQTFLSITNSHSLPKLRPTESVIPSNHLILCHPLFLLPSIFPSIRTFSNESALCIRWPRVLFSFWLFWLKFLWIFIYLFSPGICQGIELPKHRIGTCLFLLIENTASFPVWFYHFTFPPTVDINFVILTNVVYLLDFIYILLMTNCIEHIIICSLTFGYLSVWSIHWNLLLIFEGFFSVNDL